MEKLTYEPISYDLDALATVRDFQNLLEKLYPLYDDLSSEQKSENNKD